MSHNNVLSVAQIEEFRSLIFFGYFAAGGEFLDEYVIEIVCFSF